MATRSTIAVIHDDGSVSQVYCHWDGYLSGVGQTLVNYYNNQQLAENLIKLGDISSLRQFVEPSSSDKHSFDAPERDVTVFYGRDRGESGTQPQKYSTVEEYLSKGQSEEYNYLFQVGRWFYCQEKLDTFKLVDKGLLGVLE